MSELPKSNLLSKFPSMDVENKSVIAEMCTDCKVVIQVLIQFFGKWLVYALAHSQLALFN